MPAYLVSLCWPIEYLSETHLGRVSKLQCYWDNYITMWPRLLEDNLRPSPCTCAGLGNLLDHKNKGVAVDCFVFHPVRAHRPNSSLSQMVSMKLDAAGQPNPYQSPGLPWRLSGKEFTCNAGDTGDMGLIPGSGRSPGGENGNLLQYSCWENPMDRGAWWATVHGVAKNQTWLSKGQRLSISCLKAHAPWFPWSEFLAQMLQSLHLRSQSSLHMASLRAKQGRGFAFCLLPMQQEATLGPSHVFPASEVFLPCFTYYTLKLWFK